MKTNNQIAYVAHIIRNTEDFPDTDEITLDSARAILENALPNTVPKGITAEKLQAIWHDLIQDESFMDPDNPFEC